MISSLELPTHKIFLLFLKQSVDYCLTVKNIGELFHLCKMIKKTSNFKQYLKVVLSFIPNSQCKNLFLKWMQLVKSPIFFIGVDDYLHFFAHLLDCEEFESRQSFVRPILKNVLQDSQEEDNVYSSIIYSCLNDNDIEIKFRYFYHQMRKLKDPMESYPLLNLLFSQDHNLVRHHYEFISEHIDIDDDEVCWRTFWLIFPLVGFENLHLFKTFDKSQFVFSSPILNLLSFYFKPDIIRSRLFYLESLCSRNEALSFFDLINLCLLDHNQFNYYEIVNKSFMQTHVPPILHLIKKSQYKVKCFKDIQLGDWVNNDSLRSLYFLISKRTFNIKIKNHHIWPISPFLDMKQFTMLQTIHDPFFEGPLTDLWYLCLLNKDDFFKFVQIQQTQKRFSSDGNDEFNFIVSCFNQINKVEY